MDGQILKDAIKNRKENIMKNLSKEELIAVKGGMTSAMLNALARAVSVMFSVGQAVGSAVRRAVRGSYC